jgi:hypothetical protein
MHMCIHVFVYIFICIQAYINRTQRINLHMFIDINVQTLRDELQKMTKTAIRRKENLRERKLKKKKAKNGDVYVEVRILSVY